MFAVVLAALVTIGPAGNLRLGADVEASQNARSTSPAEGPGVARGELTLVPQLAASTDGRAQLRLAYTPVLVVPMDLAGNAGGSSGPLTERSVLLHRASAGLEFPRPIWRFFTGATVRSGRMLLVGEPALGTAGAQPVSTTDRLPFFGVEATAGTTAEPRRGTTLALSVDAARSGGADGEARERLPLLEELRVAASWTRRVAPRHALGIDVLANRSRLGEELQGDAGYLRAGAVWAHELTRVTGLRTAAGVALTYQRADPASEDLDGVPPVLPWVEGTLDHEPAGTRPSFRLGVTLEPVVDRFRATLDLRGSATAAIGWAPFRRWSYAVRGSTASMFGWSGGETPTGQAHTTVHAVGVWAGRELAEGVRLGASVGSTWQLTDREDLPEFREDLAVLELSARLFGL